MGQQNAPSLTGAMLGDYLIDECIGSGKFASVWRATHEPTEIAVAIKVIHADVAKTADGEERFVREATLLRLLAHPGIVTFVDFQMPDEGQPYLVMEYLVGDTLRKRIA